MCTDDEEVPLCVCVPCMCVCVCERYYHDGRRFYVKNVPYTQIWDETLQSFYWVPESGPNAGARLDENPQPSAAEIAAKIAASAKGKLCKAKSRLKGKGQKGHGGSEAKKHCPGQEICAPRQHDWSSMPMKKT